MSEIVLFAFASRQMTPALSGILVMLGEDIGRARLVWLVDQVARRAGWVARCTEVLEARGLASVTRVNIREDFGLAHATKIIGDFPDAKRFMLGLQGGSKLQSLLMYTALLTSGRPFSTAYLESQPLRMRVVSVAEGMATESTTLPSQLWPSLTTADIINLGGYDAAQVRSSAVGGFFETEVLEAILRWRDSRPDAVKNVIARIETGMEIRDRVKKVTVAEWDVWMVLRDGLIIHFECKSLRDLAELSIKFTIKDLQSRIHVLERTASANSRQLVTVRLSKAHAGSPATLAKSLEEIDRHLSKSKAGTDWVQFYGEGKPEISRRRLASTPGGRRWMSFEEQLDAIIAPYVSAPPTAAS